VCQIPDAVDTVVCAPDGGWKYHPKHVEQFPGVNKLCNVVSCWIYEYIGILLGAHPILHISRVRVKRTGVKMNSNTEPTSLFTHASYRSTLSCNCSNLLAESSQVLLYCVSGYILVCRHVLYAVTRPPYKMMMEVLCRIKGVNKKCNKQKLTLCVSLCLSE
jgi:hypothetical protein